MLENTHVRKLGLFCHGRNQRRGQNCNISMLFCTSGSLQAPTCSDGAVKMLLRIFKGERWEAGSFRGTVQILNSDRKPLIKLVPLGEGGAVLGSQSVRSFALIVSPSRYSQPISRINISSATLIICNHPAEMKARLIDMASTPRGGGMVGGESSICLPISSSTCVDSQIWGCGGASSHRQQSSLVGECVSACCLGTFTCGSVSRAGVIAPQIESNFLVQGLALSKILASVSRS